MYSRILVFVAFTTSYAAADQLTLYLGEHCNNANLGSHKPVKIDECIKFDQALSYILQKDSGKTYNLYSGGGCTQYEGQVGLSGGCLKRGNDITGITAIKKKDRLRIRGATRDMAPQDAPDDVTISARTDGDTYQCPNIPSGAYYFLLVESSSSLQENLGNSDEAMMRTRFMADFNRVYQNPNGQTQVSTYIPFGGIGPNNNMGDVQITLEMNQSVVQEIQDRDMEAIMRDMFDFRDRQRGPIDFLVSIYSGIPNHEGAGLIASLHFDGLPEE